MMSRLINFIKYNNAAVLIVALVFIIGASALASEPGREAIGSKTTSIEGVDNTLLLAADLDKFDMDFKVEKIEEDNEMYYVTYTYLDLVQENSAWQYQLKENTRRISKNIEGDLGVYLAGELKEEYDSRVRELKQAQIEAMARGEEKRIAVTEYSGLIGASLDLATKVFPNYEPVKKEEMDSPVEEESLRQLRGGETDAGVPSVDNLTQVYQNYVEENDPDSDNIFGASDNCPMIANSDQEDSNNNGVGDACDSEQVVDAEDAGDVGSEPVNSEPENVEIVDSPDEIVPADEEKTIISNEEAPVVEEQTSEEQASEIPSEE